MDIRELASYSPFITAEVDMATVKLSIGPDAYEAGAVAWQTGMIVNGAVEVWDSDGRSIRNMPTTPDGWVRLARRYIGLPSGATRWKDATVKIDGWSQGAGHAPQGVTLSWPVE